MNTTYSKIGFIAIIALIIGIAIGMTETSLKSGTSGATKAPDLTTNQLSTDVMPAPILPTPIFQSPGVTGPTWEPLQQIRDMQMQMDTLYNRIASEFNGEPQFGGMVQNPAYSLTMNVRDLKDRFVVRALMPDANVSDVKVTLDKQTLKLQSSRQQTQKSVAKNATTSVAQWGEYEQVIQLPVPVKADQMKIERKNHELIITLPKE
jgi:HSP20 family protein